MEKRIVTLAELKGEQVRLRNALEAGDERKKTLREYLEAFHKVKELESMLLWTIISLMLIVSGCNLAREGLYGTGRCIGALGEDVKWTAEQLGGNIQMEK